MEKSKNSFIAIGLMLFALFFGAGNLIFPVFMGQNSGVETIPATIGFLITGVGSSDSWHCGHRLLRGRPAETGFPYLHTIRHFLHRRPVPDHRAGLRYPPYGYDIF